MTKLTLSPEFEEELITTVRRTQRKVWFFGALSLLLTATITAGVIGGLIYICQLVLVN